MERKRDLGIIGPSEEEKRELENSPLKLNFGKKHPNLVRAGRAILAGLGFASPIALTACEPKPPPVAQERPTQTPITEYKVVIPQVGESEPPTPKPTLKPTETPIPSTPTEIPKPTATATKIPEPTSISTPKPPEPTVIVKPTQAPTEQAPAPEQEVIKPYDVYSGELFERLSSGVKKPRGTIVFSPLPDGKLVVLVVNENVPCEEGIKVPYDVSTWRTSMLAPSYRWLDNGKGFAGGQGRKVVNIYTTGTPGFLAGHFQQEDRVYQEGGKCTPGTVFFDATLKGNGKKVLVQEFVNLFKKHRQFSIPGYPGDPSSISPEEAVAYLERELRSPLPEN